MFGKVNFIFNNFSHILNNCIHDEFELFGSGFCLFFFNNLSKNSRLHYTEGCDGPTLIKHNNFFNAIPYFDLNIDSNNYYPAVSGTESNPFHIDPMYDDTIHLKALNPMLSGKAFSSVPVLYDIDHLPRNYPYTIGANEICVSATQPDTFDIPCGDYSLQLQLCNHPANAVYVWAPDYNIDHTNIYNPVVSPAVDTTYNVSVYVNSNLLYTNSYRVNVSQLPYAMGSYYFYYPDVHFANLSTCATSYYWDFGDGNSSTDVYPVHQYSNIGIYTVTLIAYNSFGSDTCVFSIDVFWSGIYEISNSENISIYPNPTSDKLTIITPEKSEIEIYNIQGQIIKRLNSNDNQTDIDVSGFPSAIYIIRMHTNQGVAVKKFVKQ